MKDKNNKYPESDYTRTIWSFTNNEIAHITPWDTQAQIGIVAQNLINSILRTVVCKRLGIAPLTETGFEYDTQEGKLYIYQPKFVCSLCRAKKAEFKVQDKLYCAGCVELLKKQAQQEQDNQKQNKGKIEKKSKKV